MGIGYGAVAGIDNMNCAVERCQTGHGGGEGGQGSEWRGAGADGGLGEGPARRGWGGGGEPDEGLVAAIAVWNRN